MYCYPHIFFLPEVMKLVDQTVTLSVTLIHNGLNSATRSPGVLPSLRWMVTTKCQLQGRCNPAQGSFWHRCGRLTREHGGEHRRGHFAVEKWLRSNGVPASRASFAVSIASMTDQTHWRAFPGFSIARSNVWNEVYECFRGFIKIPLKLNDALSIMIWPTASSA